MFILTSINFTYLRILWGTLQQNNTATRNTLWVSRWRLLKIKGKRQINSETKTYILQYVTRTNPLKIDWTECTGIWKKQRNIFLHFLFLMSHNTIGTVNYLNDSHGNVTVMYIWFKFSNQYKCFVHQHKVGRMGHCSALIKILPGYEDIFAGHSRYNHTY